MCLSIHFLIFVHVFCKGRVNYIMITWELKWIWKFSAKFRNHSTCFKLRISVDVNISFHTSEWCFCKKKSVMEWLLYYHKLWNAECSNKVIHKPRLSFSFLGVWQSWALKDININVYKYDLLNGKSMCSCQAHDGGAPELVKNSRGQHPYSHLPKGCRVFLTSFSFPCIAPGVPSTFKASESKSPTVFEKSSIKNWQA